MAVKTKLSVAEKKDAPLQKIGDYLLTQPWTTKGSGSAMWTFAERGGKAFFVKRFLAPVCAEEGSGIPLEVIEQQRVLCNEFYVKKRRLYDAVNRSATGNIVKVEDFFFYKTKFYLVTERIEHMDVSAAQVARLPVEKKLLLLKILSYSMMSLHNNGVVHGDLKISNVLFKKVGNHDNLVPKLIDFGDSFLVGETSEYLVGDVYLAPESYRLIDGEDVALTQKADVFSLGLLFHEYYTGKLPGFSSAYDFACEALLDGRSLTVDSGIVPTGLASVIRSMLNISAEDRPSMDVVFKALYDLTNSAAEPPPPPPVTTASELWICASCGVQNDARFTGGRFCKQCGRARSATPSTSWVCGICGAANAMAYRDCVKCGGTKGSAKKDPAPKPKEDPYFHRLTDF